MTKARTKRECLSIYIVQHTSLLPVSIFLSSAPMHRPHALFVPGSHDSAIINDFARGVSANRARKPVEHWRVSSRRNYNRTPNYRWKGGAGITAHLLPTATVVDSSRVRTSRIPQLLATFPRHARLVAHNNFILQITTATILSLSLSLSRSLALAVCHTEPWPRVADRPGERKTFDDERLLLENRTRRSPPGAPGWSPENERPGGTQVVVPVRATGTIVTPICSSDST